MEILEGIFIKYGLIGLLGGCFLSSSVVPFPSEPLIGINAKFHPAIYVFIFALIGSVGGSILNYIIGIKGIRRLIKRNIEKEKRLEIWFNKYGVYVLLIAPWIPLIGDPLTLVAGVLRVNLKKFILLITIGNTIRILVIIYVAILGMEFLGIL